MPVSFDQNCLHTLQWRIQDVHPGFGRTSRRRQTSRIAVNRSLYAASVEAKLREETCPGWEKGGRRYVRVAKWKRGYVRKGDCPYTDAFSCFGGQLVALQTGARFLALAGIICLLFCFAVLLTLVQNTLYHYKYIYFLQC